MAILISKDIRSRMMRAIAAGNSARVVARQFEAAPSTASRLKRHVVETGSIAPRPQGKRVNLACTGTSWSPGCWRSRTSRCWNWHGRCLRHTAWRLMYYSIWKTFLDILFDISIAFFILLW